MTQRSDIERVLDLWLGDGPTHVPDRLFDEAVAAVYRAPQRSPWRLRWRNLKVSTRLLAATIAIVALSGVSILALSGTPGPTPTPATSPKPTASQAAVASPTAAPVPCEFGTRLDGSTFRFECLGRLEPGTYKASEPFVPFTYRVPEGWANTFTTEGGYMLARDGSPRGAIFIWLDPQVASQTACRPDADPMFGQTVDDIVGFLAAHRGLVTSAPQPVTIGGLVGRTIDIQMISGTTDPCVSRVNLFVHPWSAENGFWWDIRGSNKMRLSILDAGNGHSVLIDVDAVASEFDAFAGLATEVVDSLIFLPLAGTGCSDGSCPGRLSPGTYSAAGLPVSFTYTVPSGWVNRGGAHGLDLMQFDRLGQEELGGAISVWPDPAVRDQDECGGGPDPSVSRTVDAIVAFLATTSGVVATAPEAVSIGGLYGYFLDLAIDGPIGPCEVGGTALFIQDLWDTSDPRRMHVYLLDAGDGHTVLIKVETWRGEGFDAFVAAAGPIVRSFDFTP